MAADLRGVDSHGVAHLERLYVSPLLAGNIVAQPSPRVIHETPLSLVLDGGNGLGPPNGERAMRACIAKARGLGAGFATVRRTSHFGIAAYYPMLALAEDMIGIALTNAGAKVAPTHSRESLLGTNPLSVAIPAGRARPFVLDMATSVVAYGKLEIAARQGGAIPYGWALDREGVVTTDPHRAMEGTLLPLGGLGTERGGHKGYGLSLLVEILSGVLAGAAFAGHASGDQPPHAHNVGHFFGALRIDLFRPLPEFKAAMDECLATMRGAQPAADTLRVQVAGDPEFETEERRRKEGIPLAPQVVESLRRVAQLTQVAWLD